MEIKLQSLDKIKKKEILILCLCVLIAFALRFYTFDQKSLWIDEIHTFNDSRDGIQNQLKYYKENPTYLHPPLFFVLTHSFYPFTKPERDLRIIPLIFGISVNTDDLSTFKAVLPEYRNPLYRFFDFHDLSYLSFPEWPSLFIDHVHWNGRSLFFYEASANFRKTIPDSCCILFRHFILYELQLYSIYCPIPDSLVLPIEGR